MADNDTPMTPPDSVCDSVDWNDLVTVIVGKEPARNFTAHASVLKRIDFFKGCLNANMKESEERIVRLPEDSPDVFNDLLYWAYHGKFEVDIQALCEPKDGDEIYMSQMVNRRVQVYALAQRLCTEPAVNDAIDSLYTTDMRGDVTLKAIELALALTEPPDPLRRVLKQQLFCDITGTSEDYDVLEDFEKWKKENTVRYEHFRTSLGLLEFLLETITESEDILGLDLEDLCTWHTHISTPKCKCNCKCQCLCKCDPDIRGATLATGKKDIEGDN
jgi:hypothetical protein